MQHGIQPLSEHSRRSAEAVLRRVFGGIEPGVRYRLWDGSEGAVGEPDGSWTLVIRDRESFRHAFSSDSGAIAEAFVESRVDVDGDLFAALRIANRLEERRLGVLDRLGIWLDLRGV